jgi:hypothetical protein
MVDLLRFILIMCVIVVDDARRAVVLSFNTTRDLVRYRLKWIVRDKLRTLWRRPGQ